MATLQLYDISAMATQISREFFIEEDREVDKSYVLQDEMQFFASDLKERVVFIFRNYDTLQSKSHHPARKKYQ